MEGKKTAVSNTHFEETIEVVGCVHIVDVNLDCLNCKAPQGGSLVIFVPLDSFIFEYWLINICSASFSTLKVPAC